MSIFVRALAPSDSQKSEFHTSAWPVLAVYCQHVASDICVRRPNWYTCDGDGLDAEGAHALAQVLNTEIESGRTAIFEKRFRAALRSKDAPCPFCGGALVPACNGCNGTGYIQLPNSVRNSLSPLYVGVVEDFATFLIDCGGFSIR